MLRAHLSKSLSSNYCWTVLLKSEVTVILTFNSVAFSDMIFSLLVLTVGLAAAQDTYSCPDGWEKEVTMCEGKGLAILATGGLKIAHPGISHHACKLKKSIIHNITGGQIGMPLLLVWPGRGGDEVDSRSHLCRTHGIMGC